MEESEYQYLDVGDENVEKGEDQEVFQLAELAQNGLCIDETDQAKQEGMWMPVQHVVCPLSRRVFCDPYMTPSGNCYEREEIEEVIAKTGTSPLTKQRLRVRDLIPNKVLKRIVSQCFVTKKRCRTDVGLSPLSPADSDDVPLTPPPSKRRHLYQTWSEAKDPDPHGALGVLPTTTRTVHILHASPLVCREVVTEEPLVHIDRACPALNLRAELECLHTVSTLRFHAYVGNIRSLRDILTSHGNSKIIQISAHCLGKAFLFENPDGSAHKVEMDTFAAAGPWETVSLLMILSCYSATHLDRLRDIWRSDGSSQPEYVVCCSTAVSDAAARMYSSEFYHALGAAKEVSHCHRLAQQALRSSNVPGLRNEADCFELNYTGPDVRRATGNLESLPKCFTALPFGQQQAPNEDYLGHNRFLFQIGNVFQRRRLLALSACRGMGKTALLKAFVQYFSSLHGRSFAAGAFLIDISRLNAVHSHKGLPPSRVLEKALFTKMRKRIAEPADQNTRRMHNLRCLMRIMDQRGPWLVAVDGFSDRYFDKEQLQNMNSVLTDLLRTSRKVRVILATNKVPPSSWATQYAEAGVKLVDMKLMPLEAKDAARLFLRRSRRPLRVGDFLKQGEESSDDPCKILPEGIVGDQQGALDRLVNSTILHLTGGVPGEIVAAAAEVTDDLPTLAAHPLLLVQK